MQSSGFLDQLFKTARDMAGSARERVQSTADRIENEGVGGVRLGKLAQGAVAGGLLTLLLGRRSGRRLARLGGLAAVGTIAYRAYREHQQRSGDVADVADAQIEPRTLDRLPAPEVEAHSRAILSALVAAAKSDGHIDERERALIHEEVARLADDGELQAWLDAEIDRPLDVAAVAAQAQTPEMAAEIYLASALMADRDNPGEWAYLDELAVALKLDPDLRRSLDQQTA